MLLELLSQQPACVSHRYQDFPFLTVPIWWNGLLRHSADQQQPQVRAHGDRIRIVPSSPEGMEEILWDRYCRGNESHEPIDLASWFPFYLAHIRKLLWLRSGQRYVAKNNYLVPRIKLWMQWLPDAQFVVPIRHPVDQVDSLVRQHQHFCDVAKRDSRVPFMMAAAAHYEFGPQRQPKGVSLQVADEVRQLWAEGQDHLGYALLWREVYQHVLDLLGDPICSQQIQVVAYEAMCSQPELQWSRMVDQLGLPAAHVELQHIAAPSSCTLPLHQQQEVWHATRAVAEQFEYAG
jgi:hypothetical protein